MSPGSLYTFGYSGLRDGSDLRRLLSDQGRGRARHSAPTIQPQPGLLDHHAPDRRKAPATATSGNAGSAPPDYQSGGIRLEDPSAISSLIDLLEAGENVTVMCVCAEVATCHRRVVAELASEQMPGLEVDDR